NIIRNHIPLKIYEVPTGTKVFDWEVPKEWNIRDAFIADESGNKIVDFKKNNLHVVGYSVPRDEWLPLSKLQEHLHSLPEQPDAIPYVNSYYQENWGFCIEHSKRARLKDGNYHIFIDSELKNGHLTYGEYIIPGQTNKEVFLSTYICHPSMVNDNLSGPAITTFLARWIVSKSRKYTYRIIFIPETIGSMIYLSKNLDIMRKNMLAGFNITCVGDDGPYSFLPTRNGNTLADKIALNVLKFKHPEFIKYSYLDRGSDERQYCSPGIDLPVVSVMRSKYAAYPEYHTSLDNLSIISPESLDGSYDVLKDCLELIENNYQYHAVYLGEPQLGKRGLYPHLSTSSSWVSVMDTLNFLAYADGVNDLADISNIINVPVWKLYPLAAKLQTAGLIR
ncbi:MAG: DUF4910 domain-containing protein, partial [Candidatus Giovannonibacteria bacterium]|nr:DUF4910 domain-containing protein [Candidatus Giovannonibacteria bacterium]